MKWRNNPEFKKIPRQFQKAIGFSFKYQSLERFHGGPRLELVEQFEQDAQFALPRRQPG